MLRENIINRLYDAMLAETWAEPIKWPNSNFTTPNDEIFLKVSPMFASDTMYSLRQTDTVPVIFQVDVFAPKGAGNIESTGIVDKLQRLFSKKTKMEFDDGFMRVVSFSARPMQDENYHRTMIEIDLTAYVERV